MGSSFAPSPSPYFMGSSFAPKPRCWASAEHCRLYLDFEPTNMAKFS